MWWGDIALPCRKMEHAMADQTIPKRQLGRSGITVTALGAGGYPGLLPDPPSPESAR